MTISAGFVDVIVEATGREERVPADWIGHPVLGEGIRLVEPEPVVEAIDPDDAPSGRDTHEVIDAYAGEHGIDLTGASTKAEKVAVIDAAIAAAAAGAVQPAEPEGNPDVQLVAGDEDDQPLVPAARDAARVSADGTQDPDGTEPPDENPPSGEEN